MKIDPEEIIHSITMHDVLRAIERRVGNSPLLEAGVGSPPAPRTPLLDAGLIHRIQYS